MTKRNRPIGIFDSGIGGLTVVKEIIKELPNEDIIYFGDTARLPYGNKSSQTVIKFSSENVRFLLKFGVKFIIVACNTSSSLALPTLRRRFQIPLLGVIRPAVRKAVKISPGGRIGIIGTRATVTSSCYQRAIKKIDPGCKSFTQACPLFVPLAEEGWMNDEITLRVVKRYLDPVLKKNIDTLILGCTHYPLLKVMLRKVVGKQIEFVDSAKEVAQEAKRILLRKRLLNHKSNLWYGISKHQIPLKIAPKLPKAIFLAKCKFYVSDTPDRFREIGSRFLGKRVESVQKV